MKLTDLLCSSCRKIYPILDGVKKSDSSLENTFKGYDVDTSNPLLYDVNRFLLELLMSNGGCSRCIDSVRRIC